MKDALRYAEACLKQGLTYTGAANASGVSEQDLRQFLPGYVRAANSEYRPDAFASCAAVLSGATAEEIRRIAALSLRFVFDREGAKDARNVFNNIWDALPDVETSVPRERLLAIVDEVAKRHETTRKHILSTDRRFAHARQEAMWVMQREMGMTYSAIGRFFKRDHSTVHYGVHAHEQRTDHRPRGA